MKPMVMLLMMLASCGVGVLADQNTASQAIQVTIAAFAVIGVEGTNGAVVQLVADPDGAIRPISLKWSTTLDCWKVSASTFGEDEIAARAEKGSTQTGVTFTAEQTLGPNPSTLATGQGGNWGGCLVWCRFLKEPANTSVIFTISSR
jgi:hypothetical protein